MLKSYKDLIAWQKARILVKLVYELTAKLPESEKFGLINQLRRAIISVPSNIAEGSNRGDIHFKHFLNISLGSSFELQTQLLIANQNSYITEERTTEIENKIIEEEGFE